MRFSKCAFGFDCYTSDGRKSIWIAFVRNRATVNRVIDVSWIVLLKWFITIWKTFRCLLPANPLSQRHEEQQSEEGDSFSVAMTKSITCGALCFWLFDQIVNNHFDIEKWHIFHHRFISTKSTYRNKLDCIDDFKRTFSNSNTKRK